MLIIYYYHVCLYICYYMFVICIWFRHFIINDIFISNLCLSLAHQTEHLLCWQKSSFHLNWIKTGIHKEYVICCRVQYLLKGGAFVVVRQTYNTVLAFRTKRIWMPSFWTNQCSLIDCTAIISSCYEWSYIKITTTKEKHAAISFKIRYTMETYMKFTKHKRHRELNYDKSSLDRRGIFV